MCHPGVPLVGLWDPAVQTRWYILQAAMGLGADAIRVQPTGTEVVAREAAGGGSIKQCVCSPTRHPGSFKCRQHHAGYVWGGKSNTSSAR